MLPGLDGLEVCQRIQRDRPVPVLMLTARDSETDLVVGLAVGADDYLTKPFTARELVARVHALLRRVERTPDRAADGPLRLGAVELDLPTRRVRACRRRACTSPRPSSTSSRTSPSAPDACFDPRAAARRGVGLPRRLRRPHRRLARARAAPQARHRRRPHRARRRVRSMGEDAAMSARPDLDVRDSTSATSTSGVRSIRSRRSSSSSAFVIVGRRRGDGVRLLGRHQARHLAVGERRARGPRSP